MSDPSADPNSPSSSETPASRSPAKPAARPPIQVGNRRHFTSRTGGIPWKGNSPEESSGEGDAPPTPPEVDRSTEAAATASPTVPVACAIVAGAEPPAPSVIAANVVAPVAKATPTPAPAAASPSEPPTTGRPGGGLADRGRGERRDRRDGPSKEKRQGLQLPSTKELMPKAVVPRPSRRDQLTPDLEQELAEAMGNVGQGNVALDKMLTGGYDLKANQELLELDTRRAAAVVRLHGDDVFFMLGGRNEGVASMRQFAKPPQIGDSFDIVVRGFNVEDGLYEVAVPGASIDVSDWSDLSEGALVEAQVTAANSGGLECLVNKIRGFIPASQVSLYRVENLGEFVGQRLLCVVTEANAQRKNLVLSRRATLEREKEEARKNFYADLEVGQIHEGVVRKIEDFGAFVDLGGGDGLIHISQLSWDRVKHPSEVLQVGQKVRVRVEKVDPESGKIGLSLRTLQEDPWQGIESRFPVGSTTQGKVSRLANFGAFVKLAPGIEGLIHVSELAHYRVRDVSNVVKEGQDVEVKIVSVDPEAQRIGLSLKATLPPPEVAKKAEADAAAEAEEPLRKPAIPKWTGRLKGGFDRPTGGEGLGLNF